MVPAGWRLFIGIRNRLLQVVALYAPGATTVRPWLHRCRGVRIGRPSFIGTDTIIETDFPERVAIGDHVEIGMRCTIIAHFRSDDGDNGSPSVRIEDHAFVGPGVMILPNVTIGRGAVVMAGSVVSRSVPSLTMVRGNPAEPVARCGVPLADTTPIKEFYRSLRPLRPRRPAPGPPAAGPPDGHEPD